MKLRIAAMLIGGLAIAQTRVDYKKQLSNIPGIVQVSRLTCTGSGDALGPNGEKFPVMDNSTTPPTQKKDANGNPMWVQWSCVGMDFLKITATDGSVRMYFGIPASAVPTNGLATWTEIPLNAPQTVIPGH